MCTEICAGLTAVIVPALFTAPNTSRSAPDPDTTVRLTPGDTATVPPASTVVRLIVTFPATVTVMPLVISTTAVKSELGVVTAGIQVLPPSAEYSQVAGSPQLPFCTARKLCTGSTVNVLEPDVTLPFDISDAVSVTLPCVLFLMTKLFAPPTSAPSAGSVATPSVELICTTSLLLCARL